MLMVQAGPGNGRTTKRKNKTGLPLDQRNRLHRQQRGWRLGCGISMVASIKSKQLLPLFLLLSTTAKQNQMRKHPSHTHQACNTFHDIIRRSYMLHVSCMYTHVVHVHIKDRSLYQMYHLHVHVDHCTKL